MNKRLINNMETSVHQRLLNKARESGRLFNELLQYYAMERFLYRLACSRHGNKFVLKGALMLHVWQAPLSRPTMDIDLLCRIENDLDSLTAIARDVCQQKVEPDSLVFHTNSVQVVQIAIEANYGGLRVRIRGNLGNARVTIQVDVGFGDVIYPEPELIEYSTLLDLPPPRIQGYTHESTVAEKFEAMTKFGLLNSRMKDFFDIWALCRQFKFDGILLAGAIHKTFARRRTQFTENPIFLTDKFSEDQEKRAQWRAFIRKAKLENTPSEFSEILSTIAAFILPVNTALATESEFQGDWPPTGPWRMSSIRSR